MTKLIGLSVLAFSPIPLFVIYYFRVFYSMIIICGFYGIIVVPMLLDCIGNWISPEINKKKSINDYILQNDKDNKSWLNYYFIISFTISSKNTAFLIKIKFFPIFYINKYIVLIYYNNMNE